MKLGVIGGLGPLATAYFFELITIMSDVNKDQEHLEVIIHSCPSIADRTSYILHQSNDNPLPLMVEVGQGLVNQGCDLIAMPCITAHYFHQELIKVIDKPIIHLVEELAFFLKRNHCYKVGIMATDGTIQSCLIQNELAKYDIECVVPNKEHQKDIMHIIYDNVKKGQAVDMKCFERVSCYLKEQGVEKIILGCTELSLVKRNEKLDDFYLDALELLSAVSLEKCQMKVKEEYKYLVK